MLTALAMPAPHSDDARWFAENVLPHEVSLRSYLRRRVAGVGDVDDVVQETFLRILRAGRGRQIRSIRGFVFRVAQRLVIDALRSVRRRGIHEPVTENHILDVIQEERGVAEEVSLRQEMELLAEAIDALPRRCREIIILRKLEGLSHREIARRLGLSTETVQVQIGRGMRRCSAYLRARGVGPGPAKTAGE
jgi:RNA polymerase sigma factor (sigma-70 family)